MRIVKYAQYQDHERQRIQTNDTMMGLLAGSKLAAQTLSLTSGSQLVLSQIFPAVEHIERFNLRTDKAREILDNAESLLGILAVPQVIALHEDLLRGMLDLVVEVDPTFGDLMDGFKAANAHQRFETATRVRFDTESVELFHLVRVARNTHIHSGGRADRRLVNRIGATSGEAFAVWEKITGTTFPVYVEGEPVALGLFELIGILAIVKRLAEEANVALQSALPHEKWADMIVQEWIPQSRPGNPGQKTRQVAGLARRNFAAIELTEADLAAAMHRAGVL